MPEQLPPAEQMPQPPETVAPTVNIQVGRERHLGWKGNLAVGAVAVTLAVGAVENLWPNHKPITATITHGEVIRIVPEEIDLRAAVTSKISDVVKRDTSTAIDRWISNVPGIGWINNRVDKSYNFSADFTGNNGQGPGEVTTLVGVKTTGVTVSRESTNKQVINIPAADIILISAINEDKSEVISKQGDLRGIAAAELNILPDNSIKQRITNQQAELVVVARKTAVNYMQQSCDRIAWPEEQKAITRAYQDIAQTEYNQQVAAGVHMAPFKTSDVIVNITGGLPHFPAAYNLPDSKSYTAQKTSTNTCHIAPNALQTDVSSYRSANGNPLSGNL